VPPESRKGVDFMRPLRVRQSLVSGFPAKKKRNSRELRRIHQRRRVEETSRAAPGGSTATRPKRKVANAALQNKIFYLNITFLNRFLISINTLISNNKQLFQESFFLKDPKWFRKMHRSLLLLRDIAWEKVNKACTARFD
jgi:hypothetical protein